MVLERNFTSVSNVRDKTSAFVKDVNKFWKKIVLSQNKPIFIALSIDEYNNMSKLNFEKEYATEENILAYKKSSHWNDSVDAFDFLDSLN